MKLYEILTLLTSITITVSIDALYILPLTISTKYTQLEPLSDETAKSKRL